MSFFNKKLFGFSEESFGLDIDDLSVKVARIEKHVKGLKITGYNSVDIARGSIVDGQIIKKENVIRSIREAVDRAKPKKIRSRNAICALPETKAFLRILSLPKMGKNEIQEAIKWEVEANIPLAINQVYYDWQILDINFSKDPDKMSVIMVAVARSIVDQYVSVVEEAGFRVVSVELESIAQARSLLKNEKNNEAALIIDIGETRTSFLVTVGGIACFTSSIPISSSNLTDAISKNCNVSFKEAEDMKQNFGIGSAYQDNHIFTSVKPVLENLIAEIEKSVDFYLNGLHYSSSINRFIVCGAGSTVKGLVPYLSKNTGRDIEIGNPWINFDLKKSLPIIDKENSVRFATVIGLALRDISYEYLS